MYLPDVAWLPSDPDVRSSPTDGRTIQRYLAVVRQFGVEKATRYVAGHDGNPATADTYCNVFVTDVANAYGCYLPHWHLNMEFSANHLIDWLTEAGNSGGPHYGWEEHTAHEAMAAVMSGILTIVGYRAKKGPGHVAVVLPIDASDDNNPYIAQAGRLNFVGRRLIDGFGNLPVRFFTCR